MLRRTKTVVRPEPKLVTRVGRSIRRMSCHDDYTRISRTESELSRKEKKIKKEGIAPLVYPTLLATRAEAFKRRTNHLRSTGRRGEIPLPANASGMHAFTLTPARVLKSSDVTLPVSREATMQLVMSTSVNAAG